MRLQCTSQKTTHILRVMNISNTLSFILMQDNSLLSCICYFASKRLKPDYSKNSSKIKNQNNTKINVTSQKF